MNNLEKIKEITVEQLMIDEKDFKKDSLFVEDFLADSLDLTELILSFEDEFNIEIDDAKISEKTSVQDILDLIEN